MPPLAILAVGVAFVALFFAYERGSGGTTVVRSVLPGAADFVGGGGGVASSAPAAPGGSPAPVPGGATASVDGTPVAVSQGTSSPLSAPLDTLSWIFQNGQDAIKNGYGQVFKNTKGALSVTGPRGPIDLLNPTVIHADKNAAGKAGVGSIYQEGGKYYVFGPGFPITLSPSFQPHIASTDTSSYGSVSGVIRGWTAQLDRLGNFTATPAHNVQGSTYMGSAQGDAPTQAEWQALAQAKK